MSRRCRFLILTLGAIYTVAAAQEKSDEVRLLQTFFQDAPIATQPYGEGFFQYGTYDNDFSSIDLAVQAALPIAQKIQVGGGVGFRNVSPGAGDGQSGISDVLASARYNIKPGPTSVSVGAFLTLPIGSEALGEGTLEIGSFGSLRHHLPSGVVLTGTAGLELDEVQTLKYNATTQKLESGSGLKSAFLIAGGAIYPTNRGVNLLGELNIRTRGNYILLSGGVDYPLQGGGRLRGGLGIGLDGGAPNFAIRFGYLMGF